MMPSQILGWFLRSLVTLAALGIGIYLVLHSPKPSPTVDRRIADTREVEVQDKDRLAVEKTDHVEGERRTVSERSWRLIIDRHSLELYAGLGLILWSLGGGWISGAIWRPREPDFPTDSTEEVMTSIDRPDGTQLHIAVFGNPSGIPLILTHGWGLDSREWIYARRELAKTCKIVVWDLPGLGRSIGPRNKDWSLEKLAGDLDVVVQFAGGSKVILAGHSIGGMITQTYCKLFPEKVSQQVAGIVLGQTTYKNPVETTSMAAFYGMIQKPILEPLCYLMIVAAPIVWLLNWWSYLNGSVHKTNHKSFFSGAETREQLNFISRYTVLSWPAVIARGFLAMFRFDASDVLAKITVPTMVIYGDRDRTCLPQASQHMVESIPNAKGISIRNAEHGGVFEFHQRFVQAIRELIATKISATA